MANDTYKYIRYMRDGSAKEMTGTTNWPKRVRKGKTARKHKRAKQ